MRELRQSTAVDVLMGPFLDDTDFKTPETALTITQGDVQLSKNAAAFAQKNESTTATHRVHGHYLVPLNTTDTGTLGHIRASISKTGALLVWEEFQVLTAEAWDAKYAGTGVGMRVDVRGWGGTAIATPDTAGYPKVTVKSGSGAGEIGLAAGRTQITEEQIDQIAAETQALLDAVLLSIKAKTDNLSFTNAGKVDAAILTAADLAQIAADNVWLSAVRTLTSMAGLELSPIGVAAVVAGIMDEVDGIESGITLRQAVRANVAALAGVLSGAGTTAIAIRNAGTGAVIRISSTVDGFGNRETVGLNLA